MTKDIQNVIQNVDGEIAVQTLKQIAFAIVGIDATDLTHAEGVIARILKEKGYLVLVDGTYQAPKNPA